LKQHTVLRQPNLRDIAEMNEERQGCSAEACQNVAGDHVFQGVIV